MDADPRPIPDGAPDPEGALARARASDAAVGDEGGFAPDFGASEDAIRTIVEEQYVMIKRKR